MAPTENDNPIGLKWAGRFFFAVGVAAAAVCAYSAIGTVRFISESTLTQGTVVDWTQGETRTGRAPEPGAYFRIIEIQTQDGQRLRGQADVGVDMQRVTVGERVAVRYRASDPIHLRVASLTDLWLVELITGVIAMAFCAAGWFFIGQARKGQRR
jgi:hypothetical protein